MSSPTENVAKGKRGWAYSLVVWLLMVLYFAPLLVAWNLWDPLDQLPYLLCLVLGGAVSLVGFVVWRKLRPSLSGWMPVFLLAWTPLLALALGLGGNVLLDSSPPNAHATSFVGYARNQKGPTRARFASWREPGAEERVTCHGWRSEPLCLDFQRSPNVTVTTRRGALGWEWIESVAPRSPP